MWMIKKHTHSLKKRPKTTRPRPGPYQSAPSIGNQTRKSRTASNSLHQSKPRTVSCSTKSAHGADVACLSRPPTSEDTFEELVVSLMMSALYQQSKRFSFGETGTSHRHVPRQRLVLLGQPGRGRVGCNPSSDALTDEYKPTAVSHPYQKYCLRYFTGKAATRRKFRMTNVPFR